MNGIKYVRPGNGFVPDFVMAKKIDVNGVKQHPLYSYLKRSCPSTKDEFSKRERLYYDNLHVRDVRWNFEKFLIDPISGKPVKRYDASYQPIDIAEDIQQIAINITENYNYVNETYPPFNETDSADDYSKYNNGTIEPQVSLVNNRMLVRKLP